MTCISGRSPVAALLYGLAALAMLGLVDCTLMQLLRDGFEVARTLGWVAGTLVPLAGAAMLIATRWHRPPRWGQAIVQLGLAVIALLAVLVISDLLLVAPDDSADWLERARSKAPGVLAFLTLGAFASHAGAANLQDSDDELSELAPAERAALGRARLVNAAGNYVEVHGPDGCVRLIRIPLGRVARAGDGLGLVRLHRSALVRPAAIRLWRNDRSGLVAAELDDGTRVAIGRKYRGAAYALRGACASSQVS